MENQKSNKWKVDTKAADNLLFLLENTDVLSQKMVMKIENMVLGVSTNYAANKDIARKMVDDILADLNRLVVYTPSFVSTLKLMMIRVIEEQDKLEAERKKSK